MGIPIYDNHVHLSPTGRNVEAAKLYQNEGGTGFTLVNLPYPEVQITKGEDFMKQYEITLSMAEKVRENTDLFVRVAIGPYPVLLIRLADQYGLEKAEQILIKGMDDAAKLVEEGKANGLGEIGRPHFPVPSEIMESSNRILLHGMELARDLGCPVMIHCESEEKTYSDLAELAKQARLPAEKVIKHFSLPLIKPEENHGLTPSIPASRTVIREALAKGDRFMLETDYIDDINKPNSAMAITTVPRRIHGYMESRELSEEQVHRICEDIPNSLYR